MNISDGKFNLSIFNIEIDVNDKNINELDDISKFKLDKIFSIITLLQNSVKLDISK